MKCHLLTSGRIIIKRNGHKASLCRQRPGLPTLPVERKAWLCLGRNTPCQHLGARWHTRLSKPDYSQVAKGTTGKLSLVQQSSKAGLEPRTPMMS